MSSVLGALLLYICKPLDKKSIKNRNHFPTCQHFKLFLPQWRLGTTVPTVVFLPYKLLYISLRCTQLLHRGTSTGLFILIKSTQIKILTFQHFYSWTQVRIMLLMLSHDIVIRYRANFFRHREHTKKEIHWKCGKLLWKQTETVYFS